MCPACFNDVYYQETNMVTTQCGVTWKNIHNIYVFKINIYVYCQHHFVAICYLQMFMVYICVAHSVASLLYVLLHLLLSNVIVVGNVDL